jgi:hypothetical protein
MTSKSGYFDLLNEESVAHLDKVLLRDRRAVDHPDSSIFWAGSLRVIDEKQISVLDSRLHRIAVNANYITFSLCQIPHAILRKLTVPVRVTLPGFLAATRNSSKNVKSSEIIFGGILQ